MKTLNFLTAIIAVFIFTTSASSDSYSMQNISDCKYCDTECQETGCCSNKSAQGNAEYCSDDCTNEECKESCSNGNCSILNSNNELESNNDLSYNETDNNLKDWRK